MAKKYILDLSDYQVSQMQTLTKTRKCKVRIIACFHPSEDFISFLAGWSKTAPSEHRTLNFANLPLIP